MRSIFSPLLVSCLLSGLALLGGCRPPFVDGGWRGDATCGAEVHDVVAVFDETAEGDLDGVWFVDYVAVFGDPPFTIEVPGTFEASVVDGDADVEDGRFRGGLDVPDEDNQNEVPDFRFDLEWADTKQFDSLRGDLDVLDDQGAVTQTCDVDLDRVHDEN